MSKRLLIFGVLVTGAVIAAAALVAQSPSEISEVAINAPYVSTPYGVVDAMLAMAKTRKADLVYDLGCGDGRILIAAAKRYGARGVGFDINPDLVQQARANARRAGVEPLVRFEEQDLYEVDLRPATVVTLYLLPEMNARLRPKLQRELKPGARVVTHTFDLGSWKPAKTKQVDGARIFLWRIPRRL